MNLENIMLRERSQTQKGHVLWDSKGRMAVCVCVCVCARARAFACACVCQREREETTNWGDENILELRNGDGCTIIFCDYKTTELNT